MRTHLRSQSVWLAYMKKRSTPKSRYHVRKSAKKGASLKSGPTHIPKPLLFPWGSVSISCVQTATALSDLEGARSSLIFQLCGCNTKWFW